MQSESKLPVSFYFSRSGGGLPAPRPDSLCLFASELWNPELEKAERERAKVDGGLAVGGRRSWSAAPKMAAVKSCEGQAGQARSPGRRRGPRTLSDA